ncbi:HNH endonuclease [Clostridium botulinum]|uniref:HNH endonuclease n=1 Tax=Clostridium botulinum TaxID=1491 RepID=A0A6B4FXN9_CLOBO|nr:HNH endonuclease signature motif containing protein [Clostridium botulinum]MBN3382926.1 HNH endonuclease [Clostridium botulinum]NFF90082.1 HNH endonuclease [Clostridium botulinum]NFG16868.1 HNH endonuclease [Clostridium botulinum]NFG30633.1 HNH endonuclease [Clostridium botulinum]NFG33776.1 HNH endonuclease [Clostridium botulinum]
MLDNKELIKIKIPTLKCSNRKREYDLYSDKERDEIIYKYLFEGKSHRILDKEILSIDSNYSRGWQSMGVLHYLGIRNDFKGIFRKLKIDDTIEILKKENCGKFSQIIIALERYKIYKCGKHIYKPKVIENEAYINELEQNIRLSKELDYNERIKRLKEASKKPQKINVISVNFKRNPDVVVEVLKRANGFCEYCKEPAPFIRKSDNTPYLEVHHVVPLSEDGEDTIENTVALCPNCHRKAHFGI